MTIGVGEVGEQDVPESRLIADLRAKVAAGDTNAVAAFWEMVAEQGTPLYEPHPERPNTTLATFIWRDTGPVENVLLVHFFRGKDFREEDLLTPIDGTDLRYLTLAIDSRMRAIYQFGINDSLGPLTHENHKERTENWQHDPLNPHSFVRFLPDEGESAKLDSPMVLPDAPVQLWFGAREGTPRGTETAHTFRSEILGNEREIFVYTLHGYNRERADYPLLVHFDAQWRETPMQIASTLDNLIAAGEIPPTVAAFVSNLDRGAELPCNEAFARALATELVPWLREAYGVTSDPARVVTAGQSYGGLAAAWLGLQHPGVVGNVISQSGSFWWAPDFGSFDENRNAVFGDAPRYQWLNEQYAIRDRVPVRFWMHAGTMEAGAGPNGLFPSLILSNRNMHDILRAKGYDVHYEEYVGGHDFITWRGSLADGLIHALGG